MVTYLACSVDNVTIVLYTIIFDVLGECSLDGRIVGFYEVVVDVLYDERGFTCRTKGHSASAGRGRKRGRGGGAGSQSKLERLPTERDPRTAMRLFFNGSVPACIMMDIS